ncbi:MAG: Gfo/Idh/MocA family protein [bacterium]
MSARKRVCIGIVGARFSAEFHVKSYRQVHGYDVIVKGVASKTRKSAEAFAQRHNIPNVYDDIDEMLRDPEIDAVDLCVPNNLHEPFAVRAAGAGKHVICEKPLTGYFGEPDQGKNALVGKTVPRQTMLERALRSADTILETIKAKGVKLMYGENWVYAPGVQKARRLLSASGGTIMRIVGEESHSGSHAEYYRTWRGGGGGSLIGKGCHPLGAALYLKYDEGMRKMGKPIRARSVVAEVASLTEIQSFIEEGRKWVKTGWQDVEDWGAMLISFEDGSVAEISAADMVLGGIYNYLEVYASNARVRCNINPNTACLAYAPDQTIFANEYITEKLETKAGWSFPAPDEDWITGYPQEFQDFVECIAENREPLSGAMLGRDVVAVIYSAYLSAESGRRVNIDL